MATTNTTDLIKIDRLRMYFGEPYQITDKITILQPTIQDILDAGESEFFEMLNVFIGNTTSYRLPLWKMGIDWNKITDYQLFTILIRNLVPGSTDVLFANPIDFSSLEIYTISKKDEETGEELPPSVTLYDSNNDLEISEDTYLKMSFYIRTMFNMFPKVEKAKGKFTKESIIEEEEMNLKANKDKEETSVLLPLISSCLNHPGFKYKKNELRQVGIVEFMDSVQRLQVYESTTALIKGMYSGMIDVKGIDKEEFNFMRDLTK